MKNLTDFLKTVATGVDPRLDLSLKLFPLPLPGWNLLLLLPLTIIIIIIIIVIKQLVTRGNYTGEYLMRRLLTTVRPRRRVSL